MEQGQQMRFTGDELALIKSVFKDEKVLKVLRKVFLPEIDPNAPLGQVIDLWMTIDVRSLDPDQALIKMIARNELISHLEQQLMQLKVLANQDTVSPLQKDEISRKDSSK